MFASVWPRCWGGVEWSPRNLTQVHGAAGSVLDGRRPVRRVSGVFPGTYPSAVGPDGTSPTLHYPPLSTSASIMAFVVPLPLRSLWDTWSESLRDGLRIQDIGTFTAFCKLFADPGGRLATVWEFEGVPSGVAIIVRHSSWRTDRARGLYCL